jgi:4-amino-4-deoxy-L-arabinose transferase-like glycosyltransferase
MNLLPLQKTDKNIWKVLQEKPQLPWIISILWLLLLSWVGFLWNLGSLGLMDKTEALYVEVARQIVLTNDWITPHWNGEPFFDYPIGGCWFIALSFKLFGISEWAARFPAALSAIALVLLGSYTLRYFGLARGESQPPESELWLGAWLGAGILAINPAWVAWGRTGVSDMFLASSISLALLAFFLGYAQPDSRKAQQRWYVAFPIFAGIAVLVKGPVGILVPLLIIGSFLVYVGKLGEIWQEIHPGRTALLFFAVTLPWYGAATWVNGQEFIERFFGLSNFQRFTSVIYRHAGPWYFYFPWVLLLLLPWSIYLPIAIARSRFWQRQAWRAAPRSTHLGLFACFWLGIVFFFFSAAQTKLAGYILPLIPAAAIAITLFWREEFSSSRPQKGKNWALLASGVVNGVILAVLAGGSFYSPKLAGRDSSFGEILQQSGLPLILAIIWGAASLVVFILLWRQQSRRWLWCPNLLGFMAFLSFVAPPLMPLMDAQLQLPFRSLSRLAGQVFQPGEEVFVVGYYRYSSVYYSQRPVRFFDDVNFVWEYLQDLDSQKNVPNVLILTQPKFIQRFGLQPQDYQLLGQKGNYQLIRVSKALLVNQALKNR